MGLTNLLILRQPGYRKLGLQTIPFFGDGFFYEQNGRRRHPQEETYHGFY